MSIRIAMWSGPRNISTALMRSFENRPDCFVSDEPFYAYYLNKTKLDHPLKEEIINDGNTDYNSIVNYLSGKIPKSKNIWYQKHMIHHNLPNNDLDWILDFNNCILIRHPKDVIISYTKKNHLDDIAQLGFPQLLELFYKLKKTDLSPIIIDSNDILKNPNKLLKKICKKMMIPFYNEMLNWPKGPRDSDGVWGKYWYRNVESSTKFQSFKKNINQISDLHNNIYDECMDYYNEIYKYRIKI